MGGFPKQVIRRVLLAILIAAITAGCASDLKIQKDAFFEKWDTMATTAKGHSPGPREGIIDSPVQTPNDKPSISQDGIITPQAKHLPSRKVSLKMRQADVKAVLRSLARIENQNILIKNDIKGDITVDFNDVPWDQAFKTILTNQGLDYETDGDVIRVMSMEDMERELKKKTQEFGARQIAPLQTKIININYADAKALKDNIQEFLTKDKDGKPRGSVRVDDHTNSLIIQAIGEDLIKVAPIIEKIDKPTAQILIKANIVEATKSTARELGVRWGGLAKANINNSNLWVTPGGTRIKDPSLTEPIADPITGIYTPTNTAGLSGQGFAFGSGSQTSSITGTGALGLMFGTIGGNILEMQLNALQNEGKLNILSSPSITTLDNQTAYTENGDKVPYVTEETGETGKITRNVKFEDVVLRLEITPHVIDGKNLKMKVEVRKDEVDSARNVQGNPYIIKKKTSTNLIVKDGETIVISGLTKQKTQNAETGVPWLKDVPGVGWMFKSSGKSESMEEVLIFITPNILPAHSITTASDVVEKKKENNDKSETNPIDK
jgi:type IV pilus assembly protein PilQ